MSTKKRICLLYTGGTIGMVQHLQDDGSIELRPPENIGDFERNIPELKDLCTAEFVPILNLDSTNMVPEDWTTIATSVYERMDQFDGFVVIHGTDTMHFSASAVSLALGPNLNKPVVFTGAQTDMSVLHGDARINLIRAVRIALEPIAEVVICFANHVFRGCRTQKRDEKRFDAFESPAFYPVADITEEILIHPVTSRPKENIQAIDFMPEFSANILQVSLTPGLKPEPLYPLLESRSYDGFILLSYGAGNVPNREDKPEYSFEGFIKKATKHNIPVVIASQFPANSTMHTKYEPGRKAIQAGAIPTGNMTNACATVKFNWVLTQVRSLIAKGVEREERLIELVNYRMGKPHVHEMD
ncbi:L-asparaginase 1 [Stieleria neptunia]|uniref:L-asparaginase 1 n=1 Tax=Stieleria neptunia TaxID=2527979 RepID=A0A518HIK3_9BACT|nr:asparaginase [Stieleria neptunia]QDV40677.1 L-asparaginase 1 [Stieleria neptunia]